MATLNCNHIDGNLITERTAKSIYFGVESTIEDAYNNARRNKNDEIAGIDDLDHFVIKGVKMPLSDAGFFYEALWVQFLAENKDIYNKIVKYDDFVDLRGQNSMNSTARVFKIVKQGGLVGLKTHCKDFLDRLNREISKSPKPTEVRFCDLDNIAKHLVKFNFKSFDKNGILELARETENEIIVDLTSLRYDEYAKVITEAYFKSQYYHILSKYNKLFGKVDSSNEI